MTNYKKVIFTLCLAVFVFGAIFVPRPANAFSDIIGGPTTVVKFIWERIKDVYEVTKESISDQLSKKAIDQYLDNLAYDVASELAAGATGGKPMFRTVSLKKTLENAGDKALGEFVGDLTSKGFDQLGIDLCDPSVELKLSLTLNLLDEDAPPKKTAASKCTWSTLRKNWVDFGDTMQANIVKFQLDTRRSGVTSTSDFFDGIVSKKGSDVGIAMELAAEINRRKQVALQIEQISAAECQGFKDKKTTVSEEVITHCVVTYGLARDLFTNATKAEEDKKIAAREAATQKNLSQILKDAGNRFVNTFTSKLMSGWIKKGMWSLFGNGEDDDLYQNTRATLLDKLRGGSDTRQPRGKDIFKGFKTVSVESIEDFDYINDFAICTNEFRGPENCVMSPAFLQAVNSKITIQQAIDKGMIKGDTKFVNANDAINHTVDKCYRDGLCYSNLVKLRKANIIPVGWELAALRAPVSLQQAIDCFEESESNCDFDRSASFAVDGNDHNPFYHLVDPNWVLKAPDVRCEAYAFSSLLESPDSSTRQKYCADPKICLIEDAEGNCLDDQFNYCTRSENTWNFSDQACAAGEIYAGCLTFVNKDFGNNSYIQDTLEYCSANQAGCSRYSRDKDGTGDWILGEIANDVNDLFLNNQAVDCKADAAGCSEYIVLAPNTGANLIPNGSFDDLNGDNFPDGWKGDGIDDPTGANNINNVPLDYDGNRLPNGYSFGTAAQGYPTREAVDIQVTLRPNTMYRLSGEAAQYDDTRNDEARIALQMCDDNGNCANTTSQAAATAGTCDLTSGGNPNMVAIANFFPASIDMERRSCTFMTNGRAAFGKVAVLSNNSLTAANWFDNLKLEVIASLDDTTLSDYSDYGQGAKIYMDSGKVMCSADEVGCQGYLPDNGDPMIPAVITQGDLCPAECVGYDTFAEQLNIFDIIEGNNSAKYYNFINDTATQCPVQEVGCEEFTNLDVVAQGGEGKEYFTYLRQCVEESLGTVYYTWEGTEVAGYQIKTWYSLSSNLSDAPCTNMNTAGSTCLDVAFTDNGISEEHEVAACGADTADISDDPENDPNCREFFDVDGDAHYRFQDRVIFATDNCHDYRRTATDQIYKAVPEESIHCAEANNGCSAYNGNNANNVRLVLSDNFENGTYSPWRPAGAGSLDLSNESLNNNGHSLRAETGRLFVRDVLDVLLQNNKEYTISWWMKSDAVVDTFSLNLWGSDTEGHTLIKAFVDPAIDSTFQNIEPGRWHYYKTSTYLDNLDSLVIGKINQLEFQLDTSSPLPDQGLYIDNFIIKEVANNFSVIRNSWNTPLSCDTPYTGYHLGCQSYRDLNGQDFDLKSFDHLCREEVIGCMPAIDTHNSSNPFAETFNAGDYAETIVAADSLTYLVPDPNNYCSKDLKGCTELGLPDRLDNTKFDTVYKINDPDKYSAILCSSEGLGCSEYNTAKGIFYLKDPGLNTCTYQQNVLVDGNSLLSGWFKTTSLGDEIPLGCIDTDNNPDSNGDGLYDVEELILPRDYCSVSATNPIQLPLFTKDDCESTNICIENVSQNQVFENQADCEANAAYTWTTPYWNNYLKAAQCPASEDLCTSFKDPVDPIGCDPKGRNIDFIDYDGFCIDNISKNKISVNQVNCQANPGQTWVFPSRDGYCASDIFNNERDCTNAGWSWTAYCKDYYYYDKDNIDETSCNGLVDRQNGCVLFYDANNWNGEHSQVGTVYDADETYENVEVDNKANSPVTCDPSFDPTCNLNANRLIKVNKDRQCSEWLACKSSTAVKDADGNYKIICDDLDTCLEFQYNPDSNTTKCKKWGSYDEDIEALTIEKYQSRDTGLKNHISWSDKEYTGYSIPNTLPVSDLLVYDFGEAGKEGKRLVYDVTDSADNEGSYYEACVDEFGNSLDGQSCTAVINTEGAYTFRGECQQRVCWVSPKVNENTTSTFALETRAYSVADAPFPAAIEPDGIQRLSKYDQGNICNSDLDNPNSCEDSFKKVTYGAGQKTFYYPANIDSDAIPKGICTSGKLIGVDPNTQEKLDPNFCEENSDCDSRNPDNTSRNDGFCALKTEEITYQNWPGICLEHDLSRSVVKDIESSYYCNQWYPAQKIQGTASLYDNYRAAGYFEPSGYDALFCAVSEPYVTTKDRYYCGRFDRASEEGQCNLLMRVPAGSKINLEVAANYSDLLDEGTWIEKDKDFSIWAAADNNVGRDLILTPYEGYGSKFDRFSYFNNVYPTTLDFVGIIDTMFDTTHLASPGIHRFYFDDGVAPSGASGGSAFVNIPDATVRLTSSDCGNCPAPIAYDDGHLVYQYCKKGGWCGTHKWRHTVAYYNPYRQNYYVDLNSGPQTFEPVEPSYVGSCADDCKFINVSVFDYNHGRGCLQDDNLSPTYSGILASYPSATAANGFALATCQASENVNDCLFVDCIESLTISNQNESHFCSLYDNCFQYIDDPINLYGYISSQAMYAESIACFSNKDHDDDPATARIVAGDINDTFGPAGIYDASVYDKCLTDNEDNFTRRSFGGGTEVDEAGLEKFCKSCSLVDSPITHASISIGINCDVINSLDCYQQCRVVTQLDSEGLKSALRTDIWWRNKEDGKRVVVPPWSSWYWNSTNGYIASNPNAIDDEVLYNQISGLTGYPSDSGYPANFSHFGAGLDTFIKNRVVATRVPYYKVSNDNITAGTFFGNYDPLVNTLDEALNAAQLEMKGIFFRVYNFEWIAASSTYQYLDAPELNAGNHSNPYAGPDYRPRILATCGDSLCETVDAAGNVVGVKEGITVNDVNTVGATLTGLDGSLFVNVKFFYHAHPDHMPVYSITANWGDDIDNNLPNPGKYQNSLPAEYCNPEKDAPGDANPTTIGKEIQKMGFAGTEDACRPGYKIFYHDYTYDASRQHDCNGAAGGAPGTPLKPNIPNASCYQPSITVMDNWYWYRVMPFNGWIVVYDE
ncbi:MAG: hypothetical protein WC664_00150 [Patescibacteria group bacterium]|jgi:hypothetical protein